MLKFYTDDGEALEAAGGATERSKKTQGIKLAYELFSC